MKFVSMALAAAFMAATTDAKYALKSDFKTKLPERKWVESNIKKTDPKKKNFYTEPAHDFTSEIDEYGLHARDGNSRYAISKMTDMPVQWSENHSFGFMFSVRHEELQSCGDAFVKLIGDHGHKDVQFHDHEPLGHMDNEVKHLHFDPVEFQKSSPYLFAFGPRYCNDSSKVIVEFYDNHGTLRQLKKKLVAPVNTNWHTYQLLWGRNNRYEVKIDDQTAASGYISEDFVDSKQVDEYDYQQHHKDNQRPDERPYKYQNEISSQLNQLENVSQFIKEPIVADASAYYGDYHSESTRLVVNPEYLRLQEELEEGMRNHEYDGDDHTHQTESRADFYYGKDDIVAVGIDIEIETAYVIFTDIRLTNSALDELRPRNFYE